MKLDFSATIIFTAIVAGRFVLADTKDGNQEERALHWQEVASEQTQSNNLRSSSSSNTKSVVYDDNSPQDHHVASDPEQNHRKPGSHSASSIHYVGQGTWTAGLTAPHKNDPSSTTTAGWTNPDKNDPSSTTTADLIADIMDWLDTSGNNCTWYEQYVAIEYCDDYNGIANNGLSASQACTHCGGGLQKYQHCGDICTRSDPPDCECYPECYVSQNGTTTLRRVSCTDPLNIISIFDPNSTIQQEWCVC